MWKGLHWFWAFTRPEGMEWQGQAATGLAPDAPHRSDDTRTRIHWTTSQDKAAPPPLSAQDTLTAVRSLRGHLLRDALHRWMAMSTEHFQNAETLHTARMDQLVETAGTSL